MAKIREVGLVRERRTKDGVFVWFYRAPRDPKTRQWGKRIRIRGAYGSPEFNATLRAAKGYGSNNAVELKAVLAHTDSNSLAWLIDQFMSSDKWAEDAPETQKNRRNLLRHLSEKNGQERFRSLDPQWVEEIRSIAAYGSKDAPKAKPTKSQANAVVKVLRTLFGWAVKRGHMRVNIARDVELLGVENKKGFHAWTDADRAKFEAAHALGAAGRVFYEVLRGTGARLGDAVNLGDANVTDGVITWVPEKTARKTGTVVANPMEPELARALAAGPVGKETWIVGEKGERLTKGYAGLWFRRLCDEAGLPHCSAHGVRKGEASADAKSGLTVDELKARYGWTENRTPGVYTAQAEREALALNAAQKRAKGRKPRLTLVA